MHRLHLHLYKSGIESNLTVPRFTLMHTLQWLTLHWSFLHSCQTCSLSHLSLAYFALAYFTFMTSLHWSLIYSGLLCIGQFCIHAKFTVMLTFYRFFLHWLSIHWYQNYMGDIFTVGNFALSPSWHWYPFALANFASVSGHLLGKIR